MIIKNVKIEAELSSVDLEDFYITEISESEIKLNDKTSNKMLIISPIYDSITEKTYLQFKLVL